MKIKHLFCLVLLLLCAVVQAQYGDALLAIVGDEVITLYNVQRLTVQQEKQLASQYQGKELENKILELRTAALNSLIERELFAKEFVALGAKVPQTMVQERINKALTDYAGGNVARFEDLLQKENMTMKDYRQRVEKDLSVELLVRDRVTRGNLVSEKAIKERYESDKESLATGSKWHIAVILLKRNGKYPDTDATFKEIMAKLAEGVPFEELAKKYSEGANADKGGDQGWLDSPHPKLLETISKLQPGQTASFMTDIGGGRYIIKLVEFQKGGVPELNDELREKIRRMLQKEEEDRRYKSFVRELYMKYPVRRMDGATSTEGE